MGLLDLLREEPPNLLMPAYVLLIWQDGRRSWRRCTDAGLIDPGADELGRLIDIAETSERHANYGLWNVLTNGRVLHVDDTGYRWEWTPDDPAGVHP